MHGRYVSHPIVLILCQRSPQRHLPTHYPLPKSHMQAAIDDGKKHATNLTNELLTCRYVPPLFVY